MTQFELMVLGCTRAGLSATNGCEPGARWFEFKIKQPEYPLRWTPIDLICTQAVEPVDTAQDVNDSKPSENPKEARLPESLIGELRIVAQEATELEQNQSGIGFFEYWQTYSLWKEGYRVVLFVASDEFDRISTMLFAGQYLSLITLNTPDIEADYMTDRDRFLKWKGEGGTWKATITSALFEFEHGPLTVSPQTDDNHFEKGDRTDKDEQMLHAIANGAGSIAQIRDELASANSRIAFLLLLGTISYIIAVFLAAFLAAFYIKNF